MTSVHPTRGAVLLIVTGLCVVLLAMLLAFVQRIRLDASATRTLVLQAQSRMALTAACTYILETGRIGWGEEAFGWLDIRDASLLDRSRTPSDPANPLPGPRGLDGRQLPRDASGKLAVISTAPPIQRWPLLGGVARCTMLPPIQPPYATTGLLVANPIPQSGTKKGEIAYRDLSPLPTGFPAAEPDVTTPWTYDMVGGHAGLSAAWAKGSRRMANDPSSLQVQAFGAIAWFRICRTSHDTFVVCVGAGGSLGYRSWDEVQSAGDGGVFLDSPAIFHDIYTDDRRMWFEVRWSPSVAADINQIYAGQMQTTLRDSTSGQAPPNAGTEYVPRNWNPILSPPHVTGISDSQIRSFWPINQMGTIAYCRRLGREPAQW